MAIAKDASAPAFVGNLGSTSATAVTASFSPPAGSLVAVAVGVGLQGTSATMTVTVADSLSNSYTAGPSTWAFSANGIWWFTRYYASAPGPVTVTATRSATGAGYFTVDTMVLTGAASSQAGAASVGSVSGSSVIANTGTITPTIAGSWVLAGINSSATSGTATGLTEDHQSHSGTDGILEATGHAVTSVLSAETIGWNAAAAAFYAWAALEILPAAGSVPLTVSASYSTGTLNGAQLKVMVLTGAAEAGGAQNAFAQTTAAAASWSLTPAGTNSLPVFTIYDQTGGSSGQYTAAANNTFLDNSIQHDAFCDGYYSGTVTSGTPITMGTTAPTANKQVWASYEVPASGGTTPAIDGSTPAVAISATGSVTTASFTPPAGSVLVAMTSGNNAQQSAVISDSQGLTWTKRSSTFGSGGNADVWTATVPGAITRDQFSTFGGGSQVSNGTSVTATWGTNPAAGATVLVFVQCGATPTSVADNGATPSTFTLDQSTSAGHGAFIYRANNITLPSSGSYAVTVTIAANGTIQACGISYLGVKPGGPTAVNSGGTTGTSVSSGAAAPANPGGLVFGGFSDSSGLNPETVTFTGSAPVVEQFRNTNGSSFWPMAAADALTGSSQTMTWTLGDSIAWGAVVAAYDASGISPVGTLVSGTSVTTLSVSPAAVGNALVLYVKVPSGTATVTGVSGGGCTWRGIAGPYVDTNATPHTHYLYLGTVTAAGSATITVSLSSGTADLDSQEFTAGSTAASWALDGSQAGFLDNAASTTVTYPTLTPAGAGELYVGHSRNPTGTESGLTAGFTGQQDADGNPYIYGVVSATASPVATIASTVSYTIGALIIVNLSSSSSVSDIESAAGTGTGEAVHVADARQWV